MPANATHQANLPTSRYSLIALVPWISINCTLSYFAAARTDPAKALICYLTDNSTSQPPPANDPKWTLNDGGSWRSQNKFPVYAVPGRTGALLMHYLGRYSGNMTDVENGHLLTETFDSRDYVRLYSQIATGQAAALPSLWVFILIILAILFLIVAFTSLSMHYIQRRHRQDLRRRVADGDVDLEALGIKRLTVPQEVINRMPLFVYVAGEDNLQANGGRLDMSGVRQNTGHDSEPKTPADPDPDEMQPATNHTKPATASDPNANTTPSPFLPTFVDRQSTQSDSTSQSKLPHRQLSFSQPSCAICLDDFVSHETTVRQLTCGHIFHPECVDTFLRENSSLCPMCKKSVLPKGYCPTTITNAMVRRERLLRRMRERVTVEVVEGNSTDAAQSGPRSPVAVQGRMPSFHRQFGRVARARERAGETERARWRDNAPSPSASGESVEMEIAQVGDGETAPAPIPPSGRNEWLGHGESAVLGHRTITEDEERGMEARRPICKSSCFRYPPTSRREAHFGALGRKAATTLFPGFR